MHSIMHHKLQIVSIFYFATGKFSAILFHCATKNNPMNCLKFFFESWKISGFIQKNDTNHKFIYHLKTWKVSSGLRIELLFLIWVWIAKFETIFSRNQEYPGVRFMNNDALVWYNTSLSTSFFDAVKIVLHNLPCVISYFQPLSKLLLKN